MSPVILELTVPEEGKNPWNDRRGFAALYRLFFINKANPLFTVLGFAAIFPQLQQMVNNREKTTALSVPGLGLQAVVFLVVGMA